jgi:hypothetical protein
VGGAQLKSWSFFFSVRFSLLFFLCHTQKRYDARTETIHEPLKKKKLGIKEKNKTEKSVVKRADKRKENYKEGRVSARIITVVVLSMSMR